MKRALFCLLPFLASLAQAGSYTITDEGAFVPAGHAVEFPDRYGWDKYKIRFDFSLDGSGRALVDQSSLVLTVVKRDGKTWEYRCKRLSANINYLRLQGMSVVAQCRIDPESFAGAVGLFKDDVGEPHLVFQAVVLDGQARPGAQSGVFFRPNVPIESDDLKNYVTMEDEPSHPTVLFQSGT